MQNQFKLPDGIGWDDLTEAQPELTKTVIETMRPSDLADLQRAFIDDGVVVINSGGFPDDLIDSYCEAREKLPKVRSKKNNFWDGWHHPTPYLDCPAMLNLATFPPLQKILMALIGEPMGLHLALTGWVSTQRNWHQDTYLNPAFLWSKYIAVWFALDDITDDMGPFEFVRGSHKWKALRQDRLFNYMEPELRNDPNWPTVTQKEVARICEAEIDKQGQPVERFIAKKGDVLIWHSNLMHRGSEPKNPLALRKALICHYSSILSRFDMMNLKRNQENGSLYFSF